MKIAKTAEKGFTLIEVIVTLVLVGITATLAGMWIVSVVNGYIFTKMNASTVQKAQLAMTRLAKEFVNIDEIIAVGGTSITYKRKDSDLNSVGPYIIRVQNTDELQIIPVVNGTEGTGNTLTDSVVSSVGFSLKYCDDIPSTGTQACGTDWLATSRIIEIRLKLKGANDIESEFVQRVDPRNL